MPHSSHDTPNGSVVSLVKDLSSEAMGLVREEILLAKKEISGKVSLFQRSAPIAALGAVLLLAGVIILVTAANRALTVLLTNWVGIELAVWLAPLALGGTLSALGLILLRREAGRVNREGLKPKETLETIEENGRWLKQKLG